MMKLPAVAEYLGISLDTARRYVKQGEIPSTFIGGAYRVQEEDLQAFVASRRPGAPKGHRVGEESGAAAVSGFTVAFRQIEDGWYFARCLEVPEAITQGETLEEARENIREAIELILEDRREEAEKDLSGEEGVVREHIAL